MQASGRERASVVLDGRERSAFGGGWGVGRTADGTRGSGWRPSLRNELMAVDKMREGARLHCRLDPSSRRRLRSRSKTAAF